MAAMAPITVFDGAATPVSHTLAPIYSKEVDGKWIENLWREELASLPEIAQVRLLCRQKKLPSGLWHNVARVEVPSMESIAGNNAAGYTAAPKVAFTDSFSIVGFSPERGTITGRRLAMQILVNLCNNVSTSVAAPTAGPIPEQMHQLRMAT